MLVVVFRIRNKGNRLLHKLHESLAVRFDNCNFIKLVSRALVHSQDDDRGNAVEGWKYFLQQQKPF